MENATKALLIAAAILVAILIISLGLVVYNMAAETVQNVNMSDQEIKAFNDQFTRYEGNTQTGSTVNALVQTVLTSNMKYRADEGDDNPKLVAITGDVTLETDADSAPQKVATGNRYTITCRYNAQTGLINEIQVDQN
jgi:hypothetical protein